MNLVELLKLLLAELPNPVDTEPVEVPPVSVETDNRQYSIIGLRRNDLGDVVLHVRFED